MKQSNREPQRRGIRKTFRFNRAEAQDLEKKAKKACLSQSDLIRMLLKRYVPPEKPGEEFYDKLSEMRSMADRLERMSMQVNDPEAAKQFEEEARRWHLFQADLEKEFIRPKRSDLKWQ